jgi:UDP-3-O-[3-hydroxymyristoyl] glucosamine N-acyltransferase
MADTIFFNILEPKTLQEIAKIGSCELNAGATPDIKISGVASLEVAIAGEVTFLSNPKYAHLLANSKASACILLPKHVEKAPPGMALLVSENPYASYAKIATSFYPEDAVQPNISPHAQIAKSAKIAENCEISANVIICNAAVVGVGTYIAPGVYIGRGVQIGNNCRIGHGVTLSHCIIGDCAIIHPGVRIGQDGFGFATEKGVHIKVPQLGRVVIGRDVEIGANSCIDRGAGPDTIIGDGTKIDNLVQIGHNVQTGKGCIIVSQVGIAGSTKLGDYVVLGGQVGVAGHLNIGSMVNVAAQSGVAQDVAPKEIIGGSPAMPIKQWHRQTIALKRLVANKGSANDK